MIRFNPFTPGNIVSVGMFAGRTAELQTLDRILIQTDFGNPHHFMLIGERGIGKSSLMLYMNAVARGAVKTLNDQTLNFLTVNIELEPTTTYETLIKRVGVELNRVVSVEQKIATTIKTTWDFLKKWEAFGVKFTESSQQVDPSDLLNDLTFSVAKVMEQGIKAAAFQGILITIDEADNPGAKAGLGEFCKIFTERLVKRGCTTVAIGVAGLPSLVGQIRESHPSAPRVFEQITLETLTPDDRQRVVKLGIEAANQRNAVAIKITPDAMELISHLSEGYPHFIQQFAYCAFDEDDDNEISIDDVMQGAFRPDGAIRQLGIKYFDELYWDKIGSDEYRKVLCAMAEYSDGWVTKRQISDAVLLKAATLNNAIGALKRRNIIIAQSGKQGVYRLPNRSFAVWIKASGSATTAKRTPDKHGK